MTLISAIVYMVFGAWSGIYIRRWWSARKARAQALESSTDDQIRAALKAGDLTDEELQEIGLDPSKFKPLLEPEQLTALRQAIRASGISIRAPGVAVDISSVQVNSGGSIRVRTAEVSISIGGGEGDGPIMPIRPMRPMQPLYPMKPTFGDDLDLAEWRDEIREWEDEVRESEAEYNARTKKWEDGCRRLREAPNPGSIESVMDNTINRVLRESIADKVNRAIRE